MSPVSRIAVGTIQPGVDRRCMLGALYGVLTGEAIHVQPFLSCACLTPSGTSALARLAPRHLDSWLMTPVVCRELFNHGAQNADLALVEGAFRPDDILERLYTPAMRRDAPHRDDASGACLESLCEWLDLPVVAIVDVTRIDGCCMPLRPPRLGGVLLDRVADVHEAARWRTLFESLWDAPVLGVLEEAVHLRSMIESSEPGTCCEGALRALADRLARTLDADGLLRMAEQRPLASLSVEGLTDLPWRPKCFQGASACSSLKVAVAYDQAFHSYFPDTLDLLEALGASICDFSPLRDETLPDDVDVVYIGCGCPEKYADPLSENHCMKQALRSYVESGGRVYAEAGGLAYLCQQMVLPSGRRLPMVGAVPAVASRAPQPQLPQRAEITLRDDTWLSERGTRFRGYLNSNWRIQSTGPLAGLAREEPLRNCLVGRRGLIGSRLHLNFAAQPAFLRRFFQPVPLVGHGVG